MDPICSYQDCSEKAEISCVCRLSEKYFCSNHFMTHRKENPNTRHIFSDIWPDDKEDNELCEICCTSAPNFACLCSGRCNLLCSNCINLHSKTSLSHSLEPLEAVNFIKSSNIADYLNRKSKVQKFSEFLEGCLDKCRTSKKQVKDLAEGFVLKINELAEEKVRELSLIERKIGELIEKVGKAQFEYRLDLSERVFRLIDGNDFAGLEKVLNKSELFGFILNEEWLGLVEKNLIKVFDYLSEFNSDDSEILKYFDRNKNRMPESVKVLYGQEGQIDRVNLIENYKFLSQDLSVLTSRLRKILDLDIQSSGLGPDGAKNLFSNLRNLEFLQSLNVADNMILDEGCLSLCESLQGYPKLENLFIHKNGLTETSGKSLSQYIKLCQKLKVLSLNQNSLRDEGVVLLCDSLLGLEYFEALGLQCNQLTSECVKGISKILGLKSLQDLSLDDNDINDVGGEELLQKISGIKSPLKIYIRNNRISERLQRSLMEVNKSHVIVVIGYLVY